MNFVVFSDDWGVHPSSCQHIFRSLARESRVLWVNTIGMRPPRLSVADFKKAVRKVATMLRAPSRSQQGQAEVDPVRVCAPLMTPYRRPRWLRALNNASVVRAVRRGAKDLGMGEFCSVTTVPNVGGVIPALGARRVVYYCVDDFSEWPGLDRQSILSMEEETLRSVDRVVCTSQALHDRFRSRFPSILLSHGVDLELFAELPRVEHACIRAIPPPRVGYYGLFDGRSDVELLRSVAQALPEVSFVITGPVEGDTAPAKLGPNVHFTGPVPYRELPSVVTGWSACLLPYRLNDLTRKINPLKLREYVATGKPVVSSPLPEARKLEPHLRVADSPADWIKDIQDAIRGTWAPDREAIHRFLEPDAWSRKAAEFLAFCEAA